MPVNFPILVFEKDGSSTQLIESRERLLYHLEIIDIENDEYLFWDSTGQGVCIELSHGEIAEIGLCESPKSLSDAFQEYARYYRVVVSTEGSPLEVLKRINSLIPPRKTLWSRLFGSSKS